MTNIPDCQYDYRFEFEKAIIVDTCNNCDCDIYEGDEYYDINGFIVCKDCIIEFLK